MATKKHNENSEWINNITRELEGLEGGPQNGDTHRLIENNTKKNIKQKTPGHDGIHGFWFKKFTCTRNEQMPTSANKLPDWMTKGKTTLIQKDPRKGTAPNNYRPITCLPMMWKILIALIREKNYYSRTSRGLFPAELLYIDQHKMRARQDGKI